MNKEKDGILLAWRIRKTNLKININLIYLLGSDNEKAGLFGNITSL